MNTSHSKLFKNTFFFYLFLQIVCFPNELFSQSKKQKSLLKQEVYNNDFIRNTFYTWTTKEQIEEIRKTKRLLFKNKSATKGYSLFDKLIRDSTLIDNQYSKLLQEEQFSNKRFAWTDPWATIMGWEGETYGNQLIKITLSDSSIIGKLNVSEGIEPLSFYNIKGEKLSREFILKNKSRIAVIYHVSNYQGKRYLRKRKNKGTFWIETNKKKRANGDIPFREFVIINEAMIKDWSFGTSEIKNEILNEIETLKEFQKSTEANQNSYSYLKDGWEAINPIEQKGLAHYRSLKCFENDYYLFNAKRINTIIENLQIALVQQSPEIKK